MRPEAVAALAPELAQVARLLRAEGVQLDTAQDWFVQPMGELGAARVRLSRALLKLAPTHPSDAGHAEAERERAELHIARLEVMAMTIEVARNALVAQGADVSVLRGTEDAIRSAAAGHGPERLILTSPRPVPNTPRLRQLDLQARVVALIELTGGKDNAKIYDAAEAAGAHRERLRKRVDNIMTNGAGGALLNDRISYWKAEIPALLREGVLPDAIIRFMGS